MENNVFNIDYDTYEPITTVEQFILNEGVLSTISGKVKAGYNKIKEFIKN